MKLKIAVLTIAAAILSLSGGVAGAVPSCERMRGDMIISLALGLSAVQEAFEKGGHQLSQQEILIAKKFYQRGYVHAQEFATRDTETFVSCRDMLLKDLDE